MQVCESIESDPALPPAAGCEASEEPVGFFRPIQRRKERKGRVSYGLHTEVILLSCPYPHLCVDSKSAESGFEMVSAAVGCSGSARLLCCSQPPARTHTQTTTRTLTHTRSSHVQPRYVSRGYPRQERTSRTAGEMCDLRCAFPSAAASERPTHRPALVPLVHPRTAHHWQHPRPRCCSPRWS